MLKCKKTVFKVFNNAKSQEVGKLARAHLRIYIFLLF